QKRAYVLADNKLSLNSGWDNELLKAELDELVGLDFNLDLIGFNAAELAQLSAIGMDPTDPSSEWQGVPGFDQEDQIAWRTIKIHFANQAGIDSFAKLIGQSITEKTKFLWHPAAKKVKVADKQFETDAA